MAGFCCQLSKKYQNKTLIIILKVEVVISCLSRKTVQRVVPYKQ